MVRLWRPWLARAALLGVCCVCVTPAPGAPPAAQPLAARRVSDTHFAQLEREYVTYLLARFPVVATYLGGAAYDRRLAAVDGTLRDYSAESLRREDARLVEFRARFTALAPATLTARRRIDRSVALAQIAFLLHQHQVLRHQERALDSYVDEPALGVAWQVQGLSANAAGTGTDGEWQAVIARTRAVPRYLASAERQLAAGVRAHNTPDWRVLEEYGLQISAAHAEYFGKTLPQIAAAGLGAGPHQALLHDLQLAGTAAADAYRHLREFILVTFFMPAEADGSAALQAPFRADRFGLGEAEYDWALHNNLRLTGGAAQLYAASWPLVESTRRALQSLAGQIAVTHQWAAGADADGTVREVFAQLRQSAPRTDAEMLEGYRRTTARLVNWGRATALFDVPSDYRLEITFTPPALRPWIAEQGYYRAPPLRETGEGRFYVTPTGDDAGQLRAGHDYAALADLAAREGFPGHGWAFQVMRRYRAQISTVRWLTPGAVQDSSSMWQDAMASAGWALYAEALLAEPQPGAPHGFYSPEEQLYELRGQLFRELQVRIDTGMHSGRLSFEDAVALFSQVLDSLPGPCAAGAAAQSDAKQASCRAARAAVTRCARLPTQALTDRLGKEQILGLRRRAQQMLGTHFAAQRFHLELMKQGPIPPGYFGDELLRALRVPVR